MIHPVLGSRIRMFLTAALGAALLPGCATIVQGTSQSVEVRSAPHGATVIVDGREVGTTPVKTDMKRGQPHVVEVQKPGYLSETVLTTTQMNAASLGNVFLGGGVGFLVDYSNGACTDVTPAAVSVDLIEKVSPASPITPASYSSESRIRID